MVSGGLNGGRIYLEEKGLTRSTELFLMGVASSRLVRVSAHVVVKRVVPADRGCGPVKSARQLLNGAVSLQNLSMAGQFPVFGLGA